MIEVASATAVDGARSRSRVKNCRGFFNGHSRADICYSHIQVADVQQQVRHVMGGCIAVVNGPARTQVYAKMPITFAEFVASDLT